MKRLVHLFAALVVVGAAAAPAAATTAADPAGEQTGAGGYSAAIAAGWYHSCAIRADQTIACWGNNDYDQSDAPAGQYTAVAAGSTHSCAIRTDQTLACWGYNGDDGRTAAPAGQYTAVAAGGDHSCAIRTDQTTACWGSNSFGKTAAPAGQYTAVAAGGDHSCAIRTDQTIACWGAVDSSARDNIDQGQADPPDGQYTAIAAGNMHSCALRADQAIVCWGYSSWGQADAPEGQYTAVTAGGNNSCGIRTDQAIVCWGDNRFGQTGAPPGQYTAVASRFHSCAITTSRSVVCWGQNEDHTGQRSGQTDAPSGLFGPPYGPGGVSAVIDADFCAARSLGGAQTYPFDGDGDGVADTCSLDTTRRAAVARQNALETLAALNTATFKDYLHGTTAAAGTCASAPGDLPGDTAAALAADSCSTGEVSQPPADIDPAKAAQFFSGIITGPGFCTNLSFGGAQTYAFDSDGDGTADVCSLPFTKREAVARQNALRKFLDHSQYAQTLAAECVKLGTADFGDSPSALASDLCNP